MKRIALIIGSSLPTNHSDHLRGVNEDVLNYQKLLKSANGGAWMENEIIELSNPSTKEIRKAKLFQDNCDFALTLFSGHGFMQSGKNFLDINLRESIDYHELFSSANRSLVIMDACRTDYPYEHFEGISGLDLQFEEDSKNIARRIYEIAISKIRFGKAAIFSTSENKSARDTESGGAFSVELFSQTIDWINSSSQLYLPVGDVFKSIKLTLSNYSYPQTPQVKYTNSEMLLLPFATNPNKISNQRSVGRVNNTLSKNQQENRGMNIYYVG